MVFPATTPWFPPSPEHCEAIVTRLKLPEDDRLQMTNSLWAAQRAVVGNLRRVQVYSM